MNKIYTPISPTPWQLTGPFDNEGTTDEPTSNTWFDLVADNGESIAHLSLQTREENVHLNQVRNDGLLLEKAPEFHSALLSIQLITKQLMENPDNPHDYTPHGALYTIAEICEKSLAPKS